MTWCRVLNRTVTETSEQYLTVALELSPIVTPQPCPDEQTVYFIGMTGGSNVFIYEITGIETAPTVTFTEEGRLGFSDPYPAGPLDPGANGLRAVIVAGLVGDYEGQGNFGPFSSSTLTVDNEVWVDGSPPSGTGTAPFRVAAHQVISSTSGSYTPYLQPNSDFNVEDAARIATGSGIWRARSGASPAIRQTKYSGLLAGTTAVVLDSAPLVGSTLIAISCSRNSPGGLDLTSGWSGTAKLDTCPAGPTVAGQQHRYMRLMWKEVCPDG